MLGTLLWPRWYFSTFSTMKQREWPRPSGLGHLVTLHSFAEKEGECDFLLKTLAVASLSDSLFER